MLYPSHIPLWEQPNRTCMKRATRSSYPRKGGLPEQAFEYEKRCCASTTHCRATGPGGDRPDHRHRAGNFSSRGRGGWIRENPAHLLGPLDLFSTHGNTATPTNINTSTVLHPVSVLRVVPEAHTSSAANEHTRSTTDEHASPTTRTAATSRAATGARAESETKTAFC